jgi:hypothetical protein
MNRDPTDCVEWSIAGRAAILSRPRARCKLPSSEIKLVDVVFVEDERWSEQDLAALDHL